MNRYFTKNADEFLILKMYSKKDEDKEIAMRAKNFNWHFAYKVLKLYLEKCKAKHRLAFS